MTTQACATPAGEPNVTPMIDVLLVLLIVFMTAAVQVRRAMDAQLPLPCPAVCEGTSQIVLEVLPGPAYRLNGQAVLRDDLLRRLADVYGSRPEKVIQIAGDPSVRYQDVVSAMDIAKAAGVRVISIEPKSSYSQR